MATWLGPAARRVDCCVTGTTSGQPRSWSRPHRERLLQMKNKLRLKKQEAPPMGECPNCGGWCRMVVDPERRVVALAVRSVEGRVPEQRVPPLPNCCVCCLLGNAPPGGYCARCSIPDQLTRSEKSDKLKMVLIEPQDSWTLFSSSEIKKLGALKL